ncbi:hypothetical protein SEVIR_4G140166v4 [Setaria viridis]
MQCRKDYPQTTSLTKTSGIQARHDLRRVPRHVAPADGARRVDVQPPLNTILVEYVPARRQLPRRHTIVPDLAETDRALLTGAAAGVNAAFPKLGNGTGWKLNAVALVVPPLGPMASNPRQRSVLLVTFDLRTRCRSPFPKSGRAYAEADGEKEYSRQPA